MVEDQKPTVSVEEFLDRLTKLSKETGWYIGGCGCCGSPYISSEITSCDEEPKATGKYHSREVEIYNFKNKNTYTSEYLRWTNDTGTE